MHSLLTERYGAFKPQTYSEVAQEKDPVYYNHVQMANYGKKAGKN